MGYAGLFIKTKKGRIHEIIFSVYRRNMLAKRILRKDTAKSYLVNHDCIRCGIGAKVCPANHITVTDKVNFGDQCEVCYACIIAPKMRYT